MGGKFIFIITSIIITLLFINLSCNSNIKKETFTFSDSLIVRKNIIQKPDFVIYESGCDKKLLKIDSIYPEKSVIIPLKVYYDKNNRIKRIILNDVNYLVNFKYDKIDNSIYEEVSCNPKSIIIDFSDTFKKYKIQYLDYINP